VGAVVGAASSETSTTPRVPPTARRDGRGEGRRGDARARSVTHPQDAARWQPTAPGGTLAAVTHPEGEEVS
jgi:hypothetical protein